MSTSPFMDDYSSEDYSDHDEDYYFVPTATSPPQVRAQVEIQTQIQTQSNELQNLIIDQQEDVSQSMYFDVLPDLESETAEEGGMEQSIYVAVESYFDLEAQVGTGVDAVLEAEATVEELAVGSYFDLEAQVVPAALDTETVLEEGDVIESESLETVEADTIVETVERMIEEFNYEAVESESDLEVEDAIEEPNSHVEHEADDVAPEAETTVGEEDVIEELPETLAVDATLNPDTEVEGDVIGESIYEVVESDHDLEAETEAEDMVEEEGDVVEEEDDMVEKEDNVVEEEHDMFEEEDDFVEEEDDMVKEEHDVIDVPLESDNYLQAEALFEGAAMEESIYKPLESNSDLQAEEPEALAKPAEEEWDSDAEESDVDPEYSDMDSSDSEPTEEEEDDVIVSYLKSSTTIRNKAWNNLVPASALAWAKLPVTYPTTLEDSSLVESFLGCGPMLMLQECGNAVMNVIETLLCELLRIRNDLRRVLGALFRKTDSTKHA